MSEYTDSIVSLITKSTILHFFFFFFQRDRLQSEQVVVGAFTSGVAVIWSKDYFETTTEVHNRTLILQVV